MPKTSNKRRSARDQIFDVATRFFYRDGFRAKGIAKLIAESGVEKSRLTGISLPKRT
jgi:AcrR family transcriptional regulator